MSLAYPRDVIFVSPHPRGQCYAGLLHLAQSYSNFFVQKAVCPSPIVHGNKLP